MKACLYAPLPIEEYFLKGMPTDSIKTTQAMSEPEAMWNMIWLSYPLVDVLPGSGLDWKLRYKSNPELFGALAQDVLGYESLASNLKEHPAKFAAWFAKDDHKPYHAYKVGGSDWVATVLARADEAAVRLASNIKFDGNVVSVKFGGRK